LLLPCPARRCAAGPMTDRYADVLLVEDNADDAEFR
jgi:hypothetical protein